MSGAFQNCCCTPAAGGFKLVVAIVNWFGRASFKECADQDHSLWGDTSDPCADGSHVNYNLTPPHDKYLGYRIDIAWRFNHDRSVTGCCTPDEIEAQEWIFSRHYDSHTDRHTALNTVTDDVAWDEKNLGSAPTNLTGDDALVKYNSMFPPYGGTGAGLWALPDAICGHIIPDTCLAASGYTVDSATINSDGTGIMIACSLYQNTTTNPPCSNPPCAPGTYGVDHTVNVGTFNIEISLYDKFTAEEAYADAISLLALWNLGDDTHYPWRTTCGSEAYRLGALVTFDYGGTGSIIGGPYSGETWASGAHALTGYAPEGRSGGSVGYIQSGVSSGWDTETWGWNTNDLIVAKWAEKKIALPAHNFARPCGDDYYAEDYVGGLCWPCTPTGTLTATANPADGDWIEVNSYYFTFKTSPSGSYEVQIAGTAANTLENLKVKINAVSGTVGVSATRASLVLIVTKTSPTAVAADFYTLAVGGGSPVVSWSHPKLIGPECTGPCNASASTGDFTTLEYTYTYREGGEKTRCSGHGAVPLLWSTACTQRNESTGDILYVSPNSESFSGTAHSYGSYPSPANQVLDDKYGYLWQYHIRQAMPDPLLFCAGLYHADDGHYFRDLTPTLEEARCSLPGCAGASIPAGAALYYADSDAAAAGSQDSYGIQCPPL